MARAHIGKRERAAIQAYGKRSRAGKTVRAGAGCDLVTFHTKGGKAVKIVRCRNRKLATSASKRYKRMVRAGEICRKGKGKVKRFSTSC